MIKKVMLMIFIASISNTAANCQITKGNWLVGGSGEFHNQHEDLQGSDIRGLTISVAPDIGVRASGASVWRGYQGGSL